MEPCLLFSFAHPDDESFSGVGTAMKYALAGVRSVLVTATRGERGKCGDPPLCNPETLAATREEELKAAVAVAGLSELHVLPYRDRELAEANPDEIRRSLVGHLRRVRPLIVLTFDPNGFNLHPDHVAISRFTSDAIAAAADRRWDPDAGEPHAVSRLLWTPPLPPWEIATHTARDGRFGIDFIIDVAAFAPRKAAALRAHRTQHQSIDRCFFSQPNLDAVLSLEAWRQGFGPPLDRRPADDIFAGLRLDGQR